MRVVVSDIPYTDEDEMYNIVLLQKRSKLGYDKLLVRNAKVIKYIARQFKNYISLNISLEEIEHYARTGFFFACKGYKFNTKFIDFAVFYTELYLFYQVYSDHFLLAVPFEDRVTVQKLYAEMLKYLDRGSGLNYYDAIDKAAEAINLPFGKAINLISSLMQLSVREDRECEFAEAVEAMTNKVLYENCNIKNAPLPFVLTLMEAQMNVTEYIMPFKGICDKITAMCVC